MSSSVKTTSAEDAFFTINDLCLRWKCHFQTVRNFVRQGKLKPTRFGRCLRFSRQEIERFETASTAA
jgi:excisionase family DNA binding protein